MFRLFFTFIHIASHHYFTTTTRLTFTTMISDKFTNKELAAYKKDQRNTDTPFKIIASGEKQPLRFATELEGWKFFHSHKGRCLFSYSTQFKIKYIAYKFK